MEKNAKNVSKSAVCETTLRDLVCFENEVLSEKYAVCATYRRAQVFEPCQFVG